MHKRKYLSFGLILATCAVVIFLIIHYFHVRDIIDAFSGATPPACEITVPGNLSLTVDGEVKQTYHFQSKAFQNLAKIRMRVGEVNANAEILGAYIYTGVPVLYFLEGVVPQKPATAAFDRPLDMVVIFTSKSGQTAAFSYGEIITANDVLPITLAYDCEPILPSKPTDNYTRNKYTSPLEGLRLICPREPDNARYLDNVVRMTLVTLPTPDRLLPAMKKNTKCSSPSITCIENEKESPAVIENLARTTITGWFRIGHGRGIKSDRLQSASGYSLRDFLKQNFPGSNENDFFLFIGCDGYRSIFSGREIFHTAAGESFLLLDTLDNKPTEGGLTVGAIADFFIDRCVWGLSHVVLVHPPTASL